jgi:hypothetical protein
MSKTETANSVEAIRERWAKATPGPWGFGGSGVATDDGVQPIAVTSFPNRYEILEDIRRTRANGEAIANAPTDIAFLLGRLTELETRDATLTKIEHIATGGVVEIWGPHDNGPDDFPDERWDVNGSFAETLESAVLHAADPSPEKAGQFAEDSVMAEITRQLTVYVEGDSISEVYGALGKLVEAGAPVSAVIRWDTVPTGFDKNEVRLIAVWKGENETKGKPWSSIGIDAPTLPDAMRALAIRDMPSPSTAALSQGADRIVAYQRAADAAIRTGQMANLVALLDQDGIDAMEFRG